MCIVDRFANTSDCRVTKSLYISTAFAYKIRRGVTGYSEFLLANIPVSHVTFFSYYKRR